MNATGYALIAQTRARELPTRIGLAAFICVTALILTSSIWPVYWLAAVAVSQIVDWLLSKSLRDRPEFEPSNRYKILCCLSASGTVVIYSGISAYIWYQGGEIGRIFAMVQIAGGLLHVSLHMHQVRAVLLAAVTPHAGFFLALPIMSAIAEGRPSYLVVAVGCVLYMTHLVVAVRQSSLTTRVLREANAEAGAQRKKAEAASAAKSDFLAVVSHEIRTPMNAVISAANLLKRTQLDSQQREHVTMLLEAGDVLVSLLNDVLDFSKIEAGKMTLDLTTFDVRNKLAGVQRIWAPRAQARGVRLEIVIDDDLPELIVADVLRLQQIMFNLLSNAVKFTEDGSIIVRAHWSNTQGLVIEVQDSGCGIPADRLEQIFASFEQADVGTTRRYGGTGLGLAISRRLAEAMGGSLAVSSDVGQGSTFVLTVPVEVGEAAVVDVADDLQATVSLEGREILAAEDHPVNRRILSLLLEPFGCRLTLVENGAEAVEAAMARPFDAILMDMQMPVMDGLEAGMRIREQGPNQRTPIIPLTANAMDTHRTAWAAVGVSAFLTKPIDPASLTEALRSACAEQWDRRVADVSLVG